MTEPAAIFISYRRADSQTITGWVDDRLRAHFGTSAVYRDIRSNKLGEDFDQKVRSALAECRVVLVVVGPGWASERLADPNDLVRQEVEIALDRKVPVVPVLVEGAKLPPPSQIPESLWPLLKKQAAIITSGEDFESQVERLLEGLEALGLKRHSPSPLPAPPLAPAPVPPEVAEPPSPPHRSPLPLVGGGIAGTVVVVFLVLRACQKDPCGVKCIREALAQKSASADATVVEAAAKVLTDGVLKLDGTDKSDVTYRAVSDETVRYAIAACTSSCGGKEPVRVESAWAEVQVTSKSAAGPRPVKGAEVQIGTSKACMTDGSGRCNARIADVGFGQVVTVTTKGPDGSFSTFDRPVHTLIGHLLPIETGPRADQVTVSVRECGKAVPGSVELRATEGAEVWGESFGVTYPDNIAISRSQALDEGGGAKFWVSGKPSGYELYVKPAGKAPIRLERPASSVVNVDLDCAAAVPAGPLKVACPQLESWTREQLGPHEPGQDTKLVMVTPTASGLSCDGCSALPAMPASFKPNCRPFSVNARR